MTSPGIGASSLMGVAFEDLNEPVQSALATATTGGTITAGTYRYIVTALNANGETLGSNEQTITTTGSTSTVTVSWAAVVGATGYKLYKTAAGGGTQTELNYKTVGIVITDTDTAPGAPSGALPQSNTATTPGTYAAPIKYVPYLSEGLKYQQNTTWRRPIRQTVGVVGAVAGDSHIEGDIELEVLSDVVPYFLHCSRCSVAKTGTGPYTYTYTPASNAIPGRTMSITIVRNGIVFAYIGCVVSSFKFHIDNGMLKFTGSMLGTAEAVQTLPTATWPTTTPYGAGSYSFEIPTASQIFDADTFEFASDDNPTVQYRLKNTGTGAQFINFGESNATLKVDRDFTSRTEFDAFKALTAQSVTLTASKSVNESISIVMPAAIKDTYEVNIGGQGDLVRATINYMATIDGTGKHYQITAKTPTESL